MANITLPITDWTVDQDNGLIKSLITNIGSFRVVSSGCEIGNWLGFFSQHKMAGIDCMVKHKDVKVNDKMVTSQFEIILPRARFSLQIEDSLEEGVWLRHYTATPLATSWFGDFVVRLGVPASHWLWVGSGRRKSRFRGRNVYHQYPVREVMLQGSKYRLEMAIIDTEDRGRLDTVSYWRDEPGGNWMIHHRLLVRAGDFDHVVGRFRRVTVNSADAPWLKYSIFWRPLWALNEHWASRLPIRRVPTFQTQGILELARSEQISLFTKLRFLAVSGNHQEFQNEENVLA